MSPRPLKLRTLSIIAATLLLGGASGVAGWQAGPAQGPPARIEHTMVYDSTRGVVLLFGGDVAGAGASNDLWQLSSSTQWVQEPAPPAGLVPRHEHAMAYDPGRGVCVLFGGRDATLGVLGDTWEYDGVSWAQMPAPPAALTPRRGMVMASDDLRGVLVMYGGQDAGGGDFDETWEYDVAGWSAGAATPPGLDGRIGHAMAFDPVASRVMLFGGLDDAGAFHADLWGYDGTAWTAGPATPPALTPRATAMVYDADRGALLLCGGAGSSGLLGDTWEIGPGGAKELPAIPGPSPRTGHAMTYAAGFPVLFGGTDLSSSLDDTWLLSLPPTGDYVVGAGGAFPNPNLVGVFDQSGALVGSFSSYGANQWGSNVGGGQISGAGAEEVLTAPGPGPIYGPQIRAFDVTGAPLAKVNFYAYGTLRFGARVTAGDTDGDGYEEILTSPGPGGPFGPHIRGFNYDGGGVAPIAGINFFAYATLKYGADVATSDLDADGFDEGLTAPGPSPQFGPQIRGFDFDGGPARPIGKVNFMAFDPPQQYGAFVAGGDVDADRYGEILCARGAGANQTSQFRGFTYDGVRVSNLPGFDVTPYPGMGGGRVGGGEVSGDSRDELIASPGADPLTPSVVTSFTYDGSALSQVISFVAFPSINYGANPAGARLGF